MAVPEKWLAEHLAVPREEIRKRRDGLREGHDYARTARGVMLEPYGVRKLLEGLLKASTEAADGRAEVQAAYEGVMAAWVRYEGEEPVMAHQWEPPRFSPWKNVRARLVETGERIVVRVRDGRRFRWNMSAAPVRRVPGAQFYRLERKEPRYDGRW